MRCLNQISEFRALLTVLMGPGDFDLDMFDPSINKVIDKPTYPDLAFAAELVVARSIIEIRVIKDSELVCTIKVCSAAEEPIQEIIWQNECPFEISEFIGGAISQYKETRA